ncbi:MAG: endonuclease domain-containing protein [Lactobacillales bacterium]|jgi:hypothetical protein|nr:endonuclease domain-containing protein [Lactobacillales bacterium]
MKPNEAFSHESALLLYCKNLESIYDDYLPTKITIFGLSGARSSGGIQRHVSNLPMNLHTRFIAEERVVNLSMAFKQICSNQTRDKIMATYVELLKAGYLKENILKEIDKSRYYKDLKFLRRAPAKIESLGEWKFNIRAEDHGIYFPQFNPILRLNKTQAILSDTNTIRPDFYFPKQKIAVEYEGFDNHFKNEKTINHDHEKSSIYASMGIRVLRVNKFIMKDDAKFNAFIKLLKSLT